MPVWYVQSTGYKAYAPAALPPDPPLLYDGPLQTQLSTADRDLSLDWTRSPHCCRTRICSWQSYVNHEACSLQIEGTQCSLEDVLAFEADAVRDDTPVGEVVATTSEP